MHSTLRNLTFVISMKTSEEFERNAALTTLSGIEDCWIVHGALAPVSYMPCGMPVVSRLVIFMLR